MAGPQKSTGETAFKRFADQRNVFEQYGADADDFDWATYTEAVAVDIFGACNERLSRPPEDVRFGNRGSKSVNYSTGIWYDFESKQGGGVKEMIRIFKGIENRDEAIAYAKQCINGERPGADDNAEGEQQHARTKGSGNGQQQRREQEAVYTYHSAAGHVVFEVVRFIFKNADGSDALDADNKRVKSFAQRRRSGEPDGSQVWGVKAGEYMRAGPNRDWVAFNDCKFQQYLGATRQRRTFDEVFTQEFPYRWPDLEKAKKAKQTILIPEGEKKVDRICELGFAATCYAGGAKKGASAHTLGEHFSHADVVLLPDNDDVGREHVAAIAQVLVGVAERVRVLELPNLPPKGDVCDWQGSAEEFAKLVEAAKDYEPQPDERDPPQPLMRPLPPPEPFPIEALGPELSGVARSIADIVQAPIEMCAGAVLGSVSLAVSAHLDVELPTGEVKPTSEFFCPIALSGERKTSVDGYAFAAQLRWEQKLRNTQAAELETYRVRHAAWDAQSKAIAKQYKEPGAAGSEAHQRELELLGPEPVKPLEPLLTSSDFTFEGLVRSLNLGQPLYGIMGSEGGQFVGGHGMTDEAKQRTLSNLNEVWDGRPIKRVRASEIIILPGRRVAMHLGMQPVVAQKLLTDDLATKLGFLGRVLISWPESLIGTRLHKEPPPQARQNVADFTAKVLSILEMPYPLVEGTRNELNPRPLQFSGEAAKLYWAFADETEKAMAADGEYETIKPFAAKLAEHAARLAAIIAAYHDIHVREIGCDDFLLGAHLAGYYASEAKRIGESTVADPGLMSAQELLEWLSTVWKDKETVTARDIYTYGPNRFRSRATAIAAAEILVAHGWLEPMKGKRADQREWRILFIQGKVK